ncbi:MAG: alpha/beta hydrolase [Frankiales bacterium]|nr:alpha/beta hydrolase [Frankiales bacterium]
MATPSAAGEADHEELSVDVAGVPIAVRRTGRGPDVLLIHGVYVTGRVWDDVVTRLAATHTCWVPTLPLGAQATEMHRNWKPTLDGLTALIPGLITALGLDSVTLVGNDSGGGLVLLALDGQHPTMARVTSLVLTNCDSYDHLPPKAFGPLVTLSRVAPVLARPIIRLLTASKRGRRQFLKGVTNAQLSSDRVAEIFGAGQVVRDAVKVTAALKPTAAQQAMAWLPRVTTPTKLVWGDNDDFFPKADAERLLAALPNVEVTWVPGGKTYVQLDAPDTVAAVIAGS